MKYLLTKDLDRSNPDEGHTLLREPYSDANLAERVKELPYSSVLSYILKAFIDSVPNLLFRL
jgi:hypothetical protein